MLTWRLWQALRMPPTKNPLFRRMQIPKRASWLDRFWNALGGLLLVLFFLQPPIFVVTVILIPLIYPVVSSTSYGILWAIRTSAMVSIRRQEGSYDLIRIAPGGAWQAFWGVCAGCVHRNGDLDRLEVYTRRILTMLLTLAIFTFIAGLLLPTERLQSELITTSLVLFTVIGMTMLEFVQSPILSTLIGMTCAVYSRTTTDTRIGAFIGYLTVQILTYLTSAVLLTSFIIPTIELADMSQVTGVLFGCLWLVTYFIAFREIMLFALWRLISRRLNTDVTEMRYLLVDHWIIS